MTTPYTLDKAKKIREEFNYIIGTSLNGDAALIEYLAITPFDEENKQRFFLYYLIMGESAQEAILNEYKGFLFDIVVVARTPNGVLVKEMMSDWLSRNVAQQDFPLYMSRQNTQTEAYI